MAEPRASTEIDHENCSQDLVFRHARSVQQFEDAPVPDETIRRIEELTYLGPTSMNSQPLRVTWVRSPGARGRALRHIDEGNKSKSLSAPLIAVLSYDRDWHDAFDFFAPHMAERRELFARDTRARERLANDNAHLQAGYFIVAVRMSGLSAGPMSGFDSRGMAREFALPPHWQPFLVVNVGHPTPDAPYFPRLPRMNDSDGTTLLV